ncbi:hypothetical protein ACFP1Z_11390 [Streptomyces gamaensis]|uniref:Lipoprotein n=1 Tax=Streptomyces gamaensis TaxID=1763542 RepID=A0ABW0Z147_9ACTN
MRHGISRRGRYGLVTSLAAGLALFVTGCTWGDGDSAKDSGKDTSAQGSDASGEGKKADDAYKQRQCLREQGLKVSEPKPGENDKAMAIEGGDKETMEKAFKKCGGGAADRKMTQADKDKALKFAQCMRKNGFDMPDPKFDGGSVQQKAMEIPEGAAKEKFDKANKVCSEQNGQ